MPTTASGKEIATKNSNHAAPAPPGVSLSVPTPPAGPVPTPFPYVAKSGDAKSGTTNGKSFKVKAKVLLKDCVMKLAPPCNKPATPVGSGDIVSHALDMWAVVMDGESDVRAEGKEVAVTGSSVRMNAMNDKQQVVQIQTMFLAAADFDAITTEAQAKAWAKKNGVKVISDPVSATQGAVIDWEDDFALPGMIPLAFRRSYSSAFRRDKGPFGKGGWTHAFDQWIETASGQTTLRTETGHKLDLPAVPLRGSAFLRRARLDISLDAPGHYRVRDLESRLVRHFKPIDGEARSYLHEIRDAFGNHLELRYAEGRLAVVIDTAGREARFVYDNKGRITGLGVWVERTRLLEVRYRYADTGELEAVERAPGEVSRYAYDGKHRLVEKQMPDGPTFRYAYDDETDQCVRAGSDEGFHPAGLDYDPPKRTVYVHSTPAPRVLVYDATRALVREATPDGAWVRELARDEDGFILVEKNAAGEEITFEYDARGNCVKKTDAAGREWSWTYLDDRVVERIEPGKLVTRCVYDARGELESMTTPDGVTVSVERDRWGRVAGVNGPDGRALTFAYDGAHNLVRRTDARNHTVTFTYDALGRQTSYTDDAGSLVRIENDPRGRPLSLTYPDATTERYTWDARGRVTSFTSRRGDVFRMEWEGTDALRRIVAPDGQAWTYENDVLERVVGVVSPRNERYEIRHDRAGRVREETTFDGSTFRYQHDRAGRLARVELPGDAWLSYTYDEAGQVIEEDSPHGRRTFAWDERGAFIEAVLHDYDRPIVVTAERDAAGRTVVESQGGRALRYTYDRSGRVASRTLPDGQTTRYFYDAAGDLSGIDHDGHKVAFQHDRRGREVRRHVYRGGIDICRAVDGAGRWLEQWVSARPEGVTEPASLVRRRYSYDTVGRPIELQDGRWGRAAYAYSPEGRLLGVEARHGMRLDYDPSGALIGLNRYTDADLAPWKVRAGNVLVRTPRASYTYDDARRRRRKLPSNGDKPTEYQWDARSRLREVRLPSGERVLLTYDAFGRRTRKVIVSPPISPETLDQKRTPPRVVDYLWDGVVLAAEIDSVRGTRVFVHHPRTMFPLLQIEDGEVYSYVTDPMGTPRELVDARGRLAWAASISTFSDVLETYRDPGAAEVSSPFRQLGHYADEETGLLYTIRRYFDPETARWLSIDPLLILSGGDLFGLTKSPTFTVDPLGMQETPPVGIYGNSMPGLEKHEPLQACWGEHNGLGPRGTWPFQRANPVIGLEQGPHDDVHRIADDIFRKRYGVEPSEIHTLSPQEIIKVQAEAMRKAGVPQEQIDAVIAASKKHAPKFVCSV
ncbi:Rhs-family protein [Minicystis rosea]|nr:Rhs-family protein [Minicystis rosea]